MGKAALSLARAGSSPTRSTPLHGQAAEPACPCHPLHTFPSALPHHILCLASANLCVLRGEPVLVAFLRALRALRVQPRSAPRAAGRRTLAGASGSVPWAFRVCCLPSRASPSTHQHPGRPMVPAVHSAHAHRSRTTRTDHTGWLRGVCGDRGRVGALRGLGRERAVRARVCAVGGVRRRGVRAAVRALRPPPALPALVVPFLAVQALRLRPPRDAGRRALPGVRAGETDARRTRLMPPVAPADFGCRSHERVWQTRRIA